MVRAAYLKLIFFAGGVRVAETVAAGAGSGSDILAPIGESSSGTRSATAAGSATCKRRPGFDPR